MSVCRSGIIFFSVTNSAAISASAAYAITVLIICTIVNTGSLSFGFGSFSERNIFVSDLLLARDSLRNPASACATKFVSLFLNMIPLLGYVVT